MSVFQIHRKQDLEVLDLDNVRKRFSRTEYQMTARGIKGYVSQRICVN